MNSFRGLLSYSGGSNKTFLTRHVEPRFFRFQEKSVLKLYKLSYGLPGLSTLQFRACLYETLISILSLWFYCLFFLLVFFQSFWSNQTDQVVFLLKLILVLFLLCNKTESRKRKKEIILVILAAAGKSKCSD